MNQDSYKTFEGEQIKILRRLGIVIGIKILGRRVRGSTLFGDLERWGVQNTQEIREG